MYPKTEAGYPSCSQIDWRFWCDNISAKKEKTSTNRNHFLRLRCNLRKVTVFPGSVDLKFSVNSHPFRIEKFFEEKKTGFVYASRIGC